MTGSINEMAVSAAEELAETLKNLGDQKIVLAESCSCGMAAALLGGVPGISEFLCGSAVTYRAETKTEWLQIDSDYIAQHTAESAETTQQMAIAVLESTAEADWSAAITGHLGPDAGEHDGAIFICIGVKAWDEADESQECYVCTEATARLQSTSRRDRQMEAASLLLQTLNQCLADL